MAIKVDKYDKRFGELIRTRDVVCQRCLRHGRLECSHIFGRRNKGAGLRWSTMNAKGLCHTCHRWWHSNPCDAREWLVGIIGQKQYDKLLLIANTAIDVPTQEEMDLMYQEMKLELEYLKSIPASQRLHLQFRNRYKPGVRHATK